MSEWNFQRDETPSFEEGPHRVRITLAEKTTSKQGNPMLKLQLQVSGNNTPVFHYITFMENNRALTNRLLTQFFDSFQSIPEGEFDTSKWVGAEGAAMIKSDMYNGMPVPRVGWFIHGSRQTGLPEFVDTKAPNKFSQSKSTENNEATESQAPQQQTETTEQQQPKQNEEGVQVTLLPNGQIRLPNGEIMQINTTNVEEFGPNQSWNNQNKGEAEHEEFMQQLSKFMRGATV